jgi:hypothetical protein
MRNRVVLLMLLMVALPLCAPAGQGGQQFPPPGQTRDPQWNRVLKLPDGRILVTDGALALDAAIAKPASLPATVLPEQTGKRYADIMDAKHEDDFALSSLTSGERMYLTPSGIGINTNYIDYLKRIVSGAIRFRMNKSLDPIVIVVGGKPAGVVMPMVAPKK